jgi:hypothetical protein
MHFTVNEVYIGSIPITTANKPLEPIEAERSPKLFVLGAEPRSGAIAIVYTIVLYYLIRYL